MGSSAKGKIRLPLLLCFFLQVASVFGQTGVPCTVTYIANEGFLITTKNKKILVDALFGGIRGNWCDQPGDSVAGLMLNDLDPFDNIDVVLVTHRHADHFKAEMTLDFLKNNEKAILVCPEQAHAKLVSLPGYQEVSDRIIGIESTIHPDTTVSANGIVIRAMRFRHGSWFETDSVTGKKTDLHEGVENLGYLVEADGVLFLHTGDCNTADKASFAAYDLKSKEIDIVFLDRVFLRQEGQELLNEHIRTNNIILMHIEPNKRDYYKTILKEAPIFFIFSLPLETKKFGSPESNEAAPGK